MREGGEGGRGGGKDGGRWKGEGGGGGERGGKRRVRITPYMYSLDGTDPSHWDQRTHNTSLTLGPEDTQHIPYTGTRGHTTHHLHWDQRDWFIFLVTGLITFTGTAAGLLPRLQLVD